MTPALLAVGAAIAAVLGDRGISALLRVRSSNRLTTADASVRLQEAAAVAIQNAKAAADQAIAYAHEETAQLRAELLQVRQEFAAYRAQTAADALARQQEWAARDAASQATIRALQEEVRKVRSMADPAHLLDGFD